MKFFAPRRRRRFRPEIISLENRNLLTAVVTCLGQDGHDLVGPDASPGSDGIEDLHFQITGLSAPVEADRRPGTGGFRVGDSA